MPGPDVGPSTPVLPESDYRDASRAPSTARTTVVIATRNRAAELARTLTELRALRPSPAIVVLDNASDDDTAGTAEAFPDVEVVRLPRNLAAAARNLGVAMARTPYVAFSDDDSWWAADAIPEAERLLDEHPRLGLVAGRTLVGADQREDPVNELMARSPLGHLPGLPGPSVLGFIACAAIVRKEAYLQAGGFNPLFGVGGEETLLSLDMAARGWHLCYVPDVRAHHHPSAQRPPNSRRKRTERRNSALVVWMRRPLRRCAAETADLLRRATREPETLLTIAAIVRRLPRALAQRRTLPPDVERSVRTLELAEAS
ncbi:glycosyltransferase family 2 protein [Nocardia bhagyanarayanae]|uniref:GT2 family glycosyltransferase n=1 Tax=Nocardia bhagyanarayanae TaxID=1215925 RepID=A0A543FBS4_9NOCA|nr:glycosyltransferase [Nocardia bhagyanarayanae]TQM31236.1 GT2 family glycosyltransferase [Nocardia bhagyanarayanae]